ncbi:SDR family NAD(P)-dependent oxidoreductase [Nocardia amikacinitolerans]|uniref:SDR family NAD(P)-dependent oxidoreductase n=1 Tax=Nocardia amikacinitolerans TaxID=756689 RepID=UPI0020A539DE|nr:SDR family oxidoreductase [Nocardia amikacinitolerans]MCP2288770.1 Short-chain dehydrogenase [Nocardia amikacinitolerans]
MTDTTPTALITGASRGIGLGIASSLARKGYGLTISARDPDRLAVVAHELSAAGAADVLTVAANMADADGAQTLLNAHAQRFGTLSALILNAGVGTAGPLADASLHRFDKTFAVNLRAPVQLIQQALPLLRAGAALAPERGAKVIALSSITGVYAEAGLAAYGAAKAALISLFATLNAEESGNGITATTIAPGYVDTDMSAWIHDRIAPEQMLAVSDVVEMVDSLLRLSSRAVVSNIVMSRAGTSGYSA